MALNIETANIGYSTMGTQQLINKINLEAIPNACDVISSKSQEVATTIDTVWQGASASAFKKKLSDDTVEIINQLREIGQGITEQLQTIGSNVEKYDNDLAEQIKNW